jgi:NagD protein
MISSIYPYKAILTDMDGVLYRGNQVIQGSIDTLQKLLAQDIPFLCLTNNSGATPKALANKLVKLGFSALSPDHFLTSGQVVARMVQQQSPGASVYCVGETALHQTLVEAGLSLIPDNDSSLPDYVVVGKTENFNFTQLKQAVRAVRLGARFMGTNPDLLDPIEDDLEPACGSLLAAIAAPAEQPPYIVGKPNPLMFSMGLAQLGMHRADTLMVGDRMDTDILGAVQIGMASALVLSGFTPSRESIRSIPYQPTMVINRLADIFIKLNTN